MESRELIKKLEKLDISRWNVRGCFCGDCGDYWLSAYNFESEIDKFKVILSGDERSLMGYPYHEIKLTPQYYHLKILKGNESILEISSEEVINLYKKVRRDYDKHSHEEFLKKEKRESSKKEEKRKRNLRGLEIALNIF